MKTSRASLEWTNNAKWNELHGERGRIVFSDHHAWFSTGRESIDIPSGTVELGEKYIRVTTRGSGVALFSLAD